jgi:drug/metabolite transporter (DMT)-like permease
VSDHRSRPPSTGAVVAAFAAVYILWGSTYLGIRFTIETLPPFLTQGLRFMAAGLVLYAWASRTGAPKPSSREWAAGWVTGGLLFLGGTGAVVWAERIIPSGVAALIVATEPMAFVLLESVRHRRMPRGLVLAGIGLGLVGLGILVGPARLAGGARVDLAAAAVLVVGTFGWAAGSLFSRHSRMPSSPVMATAITLLCGGALLAILGLTTGELSRFDPAAVTVKSLVAVVYLFVFGSLVGFSAYLWLLRVSTPARVSTYAYVNPIVAVLLGWAVGGEGLSARILLAAGVIIGAVALILRHGGEESGEIVPEQAELPVASPETLHA